jgi:hypothetical protein
MGDFVKAKIDKWWNEDFSGKTDGKVEKKKKHIQDFNELEDLREHIDFISYNLGKVYQHAKDRSRKEFNKSKNSLRRRFHHSYNNEESGFKA